MITELSIYLPDAPGQFGRVLKLLADDEVNIRGFSVDLGGPYSQVRMVSGQIDKAKATLEANGYTVQPTKVFLLSMQDESGRLHRVAEVLGNDGVNIKYGYCTLGLAAEGNEVLVVLKVDETQTERARSLLEREHIADHNELPSLTGDTVGL